MKKKDLEVGKTYLWIENIRSAGKVVTVESIGKDYERRQRIAELKAEGYERAMWPATGEHAVLVTYQEVRRGGSVKIYNQVTLGSLREAITTREFAARLEAVRLERIARDDAKDAKKAELEELADSANAALGGGDYFRVDYTNRLIVSHYNTEELARKILAF